jgi:hypothetical protein
MLLDHRISRNTTKQLQAICNRLPTPIHYQLLAATSSPTLCLQAERGRLFALKVQHRMTKLIKDQTGFGLVRIGHYYGSIDSSRHVKTSIETSL